MGRDWTETCYVQALVWNVGQGFMMTNLAWPSGGWEVICKHFLHLSMRIPYVTARARVDCFAGKHFCYLLHIVVSPDAMIPMLCGWTNPVNYANVMSFRASSKYLLDCSTIYPAIERVVIVQSTQLKIVMIICPDSVCSIEYVLQTRTTSRP